MYLVDRKSKTSAIVTLYKEKSIDSPIVGYLRENAEINVVGFLTNDFSSSKAERWALISSEAVPGACGGMLNTEDLMIL